jgi:hypothetical protein
VSGGSSKELLVYFKSSLAGNRKWKCRLPLLLTWSERRSLTPAMLCALVHYIRGLRHPAVHFDDTEYIKRGGVIDSDQPLLAD